MTDSIIGFNIVVDMARVANFTDYHITSAKLALSSAIKIEDDQTRQLSENYIPLCASSIISSTAALESNINEILYNKKNFINSSQYQQKAKLFIKHDFLKYEWLETDKSIWAQLKRKPAILPKYDIVAFLLTGDFPIHNSLTQDIEYLVRLRNALVHFTPEREDELEIHQKINTSRKNRFTLSPLYEDGHIIFPHRIICTDCAKWCNNTAVTFIEQFNSNYMS